LTGQEEKLGKKDSKPINGKDRKDAAGVPDKPAPDAAVEKEIPKASSTTIRPAIAMVQRSTDELRAMVQVIPPMGGGDDITEEAIYKALKEKKISVGIDEQVLKKIVDEKIYNQTVTIASGEAAVNGVDAQLIFHYDKLIQRQDRSMDNLQRIDYKELGKIINTPVETLLLEKIRPTEGNSGRTVTNKKIRQVKGKDLRIRAGKGVRGDESGLKWYSEIAGQVLFRNDQISVENILELEDVNAATGNVHFNGSILIKGIVDDGFMVESSADIRILGNVGAAKLQANGNISVVGGVFGKGNARLVSTEGGVYIKFAQDTVISAVHEIVIDEYARNCELRAGHSIHVVNENPARGTVLGGSVSAIEEVHCNNIGSEMEMPTKVMVGISKEEIDRMTVLESNAVKHLNNLDNLRKSMFILQREKRQSGGKLDRRKQELYERFLVMLQKLRKVAHAELRELIKLFAGSYVHKKCYLHVHGKIYPNVSISIQHETMDVQKIIEFATLTLHEGEISVLPFMDHQNGEPENK